MDSEAHHNFSYVNSDSSDDEELYWLKKLNPFERWVNDYYDELQELYKQFKENGQRVFGRVFLQAGDFGSFTRYVYDSSHVF